MNTSDYIKTQPTEITDAMLEKLRASPATLALLFALRDAGEDEIWAFARLAQGLRSIKDR